MAEVSDEEIEIIAKCTGEIREKYKDLLRIEAGKKPLGSVRKAAQNVARKIGINYKF